MNRPQEKMGRALSRAMQGLEFVATLHDKGHGGPRVEVRHPDVDPDGRRLLVALVSLEEPMAPRVTYALPIYREAIERAVARVAARRAA